MEWVETTGRTIEEAKDAALDQLGVDELDAEFEVLEEAKLGLFGRVRSEARVRARVRPSRPPPKEDRRDRRRRAATGAGETAVPAAEAPQRGGPDKQPATRKPPRAAARTSGEGQGEHMDDDVPLAQQAEAARDFLAGLVTSIGGQASVQIREIDENTVEVRVQGDQLGLLIGPRGSTLSAVQDVTRTVVQRRTGGRSGRIMVDVGGYREKRREALQEFTRQIAAEVLRTGQRRVLEPMQAPDRKVVHDTINEIDGVATVSEGEEPRRRVVIQPA